GRRSKVDSVPRTPRAASKKVASKKGEPAKQVSFKRFPSARDGRPTSIVGVGASAGGLEALEQLLAALPNSTGMAFVLVQHLAPMHESILSQLLARATKMPVMEVKQGMAVKADRV